MVWSNQPFFANAIADDPESARRLIFYRRKDSNKYMMRSMKGFKPRKKPVIRVRLYGRTNGFSGYGTVG